MARRAWLVVVALAGLWLVPASVTAAPADDLSQLASHVDAAIAALQRSDLATARGEMDAFNAGWASIEDQVRGLSRSSYRAIEDAQGEANFALAAQSDNQAALLGLVRLRAECDAFALAFKGAAAPTPRAAAPDAPGLAAAVQHLATAHTRLVANDAQTARSEVDAFARVWPDVEGQVKARSAQVYTDTENNTARVRSLLNQRPPDTSGADALLVKMQADLAPIVASGNRYTAFDAGIILLREGLEALLVVGALLAFVRKSGADENARWIWIGSGAALVASVAVALTVNILFSQAAAGANRELLEGVTGLVAAVLLLYVSYWLHSKSSLGAWQRYLHDRGGAALASNSVISLSVLAFLAVFREGAETVLFYVGIAPAIDIRDLLLGLGVASALLMALGVAILGLGVRLPMRPFFLVSSLLIYYLAFKFVGAGIHALQVAGFAPATAQPQLPANDLIGLFPTWETTAAQALLLIAALVVVLRARVPRSALAAVLILLIGAAPTLAQTTSAPGDGRLGGDLSVNNRTSRAFGQPGPTLSADELVKFMRGDGEFEASFVAGAAPANSGLGPRFLNASCSGCHIGDGRGLPVVGPGPRRSMALVRVSVPGQDGQAPLPVPGIGTQIRDHATIGFVPDADVQLAWRDVPGAYDDGAPYSLRAPVVSITLPDGSLLPADVLTSLRIAPPVFGRGLLEAVPDDTILALADPDDVDGDGISGRPNRLPEGIGRFGLKANTATLLTQTAAAFAADMGVSSPMFTDADGSIEVSDDILDSVTFYVRTLAVPARRPVTPVIAEGEAVFHAAGCAACHTPAMETGDSPVAALRQQAIAPYSDLLLHDMGPDLADGRPDFAASGAEWRTPPLWGIGLTDTVLGARGAYLHDGRARSLEEAILWHGGEAATARDWFRAASAEQRAALIAFLRSL